MKREKQKDGLPAGVRLVQLENGLTLVLKEDHRSPVATVHAWCRAGSVSEGEWMGAGMSHVLEHSLFKGTTTRPGSRIDQEVQAVGGQMNACTSFNYTLYYIDVPSSGVSVAVDILCDIVQHATLPPVELEKERQVILREMDMGQDDPDRRSSRRLFEVAYQVSPYRYPIIGYRDVFETFTRDDLMAYYQRMYAPNNLFFVVVGDMDAAAIEEQVRHCFAGAKRKALPPVVLPVEPPQMGARVVEECGPVELCRTHLAWHIPCALHPDMPALGVITTLLGNGRSSRLFQKIRQEAGLVQNIDAWLYTPGEQGLIGISAETESEKYRAALEAIHAQVQLLSEELVSEEELEKVKKQYLVGLYSTRKTMSGQALDLGSSWLTAADLNFSARGLELIRALTPKDIRRIAQSWFRENNRVMYSLLPEGMVQTEQVEKITASKESIQKEVLAGGLCTLLQRNDQLPFVELRIVFQGGLMCETDQNNGLTAMMSRLMLKGTLSRSAEEIAKEIENVGGKIENWVSHSSFGLSVEVLKDDFALGMGLLQDVVTHPTFPEDAFKLEQGIILAGIRAEKDQMLTYALKKMREELFGPISFGLSANGSEASVSAMQQADVEAQWEKLVTPQNSVLSVFGDIDPEKTRGALHRFVAEWKGRGNGKFQFAEEASWKEGKRQIEEKQPDKKQAVVVIGYPGLTIFDERIYALTVLQGACSDLGSRLFLRIREELALAYYVGAYQQCSVRPGYFCFYAGTEPSQTERVVQELFQQAEFLRQKGLTAEELARAKAKLLGERAIGRQDLGEVARVSAISEIAGLGYDYAEKEDALLQKVTLEDVQRVAHDMLDPKTSVVSVVRG